MRIANSVEIPGSPGNLFDALLDLDLVAPCLPGATLGPAEAGSEARPANIAVRFGPMRFNYAGQVRVVSSDPSAREALMEAEGAETGGAGTARARITMAVSEAEGSGSSRLAIDADVEMQGSAAQYGHGLIEEVAEEMLDEFAGNLSARLAAGPDPAAATAPAAPTHLNGLALAWRVLRRRLARLFGRGGPVGGRGEEL